jgi:low affinity Fe/Cu permease
VPSSQVRASGSNARVLDVHACTEVADTEVVGEGIRSGIPGGMSLLRRIALRLPQIVGSPQAFLAAIVVVLGWLAWGFAARWSTTWLLWPSALASVLTFLIAFSLQYTQNRDTRAIQLKLDEILRASAGARGELMKVERLSDSELTEVEDEIVRERARSTTSEAS